MAKKKAKPKKIAGVDLELHEAAVAFRDSLTSKADAHHAGTYPLWHGWALFEAFIAGAKWQAKQSKK